MAIRANAPYRHVLIVDSNGIQRMAIWLTRQRRIAVRKWRETHK